MPLLAKRKRIRMPPEQKPEVTVKVERHGEGVVMNQVPTKQQPEVENDLVGLANP